MVPDDDRGLIERRSGDGDDETRIRHQALTQWLKEHTAYGGTMSSESHGGGLSVGENIHSAFGGKALDSHRREDAMQAMFGRTVTDASRHDDKMQSLFGRGGTTKDKLQSPSYKGRVTDSRRSDEFKDYAARGSSRLSDSHKHVEDKLPSASGHRGSRVTDSQRLEDKFQSPLHGGMRGSDVQGLEEKIRFGSYGGGVSDVHRLEDKIQSEVSRLTDPDS